MDEITRKGVVKHLLETSSPTTDRSENEWQQLMGRGPFSELLAQVYSDIIKGEYLSERIPQEFSRLKYMRAYLRQYELIRGTHINRRRYDV